MSVIKRLASIVMFTVLSGPMLPGCHIASGEGNGSTVSDKAQPAPASVTPRPGLGDEDVLDLPVKTKIDGSDLKFILVARNAFDTDSEIDTTHREVANYEITLRLGPARAYVLFYAKTAKGELRQQGGATSLGPDAMYIINRADLAFVGRTFFK